MNRLFLFFVFLVPSPLSAETSHDDVLKQVRSLRDRPYLPFNTVDKKQGDDTLRREGLPKPTAKSGCYLVYGNEEGLNRIKFLQKVGDRKIETDDDGRNWIESLKVGDKADVVVIEPQQELVRGRVATKWKSRTTTFQILSLEAHVRSRVVRTVDNVDGYERISSVGNAEPVELYIHKKGKRSSLIMQVTYREKEWIFAEAVTIALNGQSFTFRRAEGLESDRKVLDGGIRESFWFDLSERPDFVSALLADVDAENLGRYVVRFRGEVETDDKSISEILPAMRTVASYYYLDRFGVE